jgi:AraC-like DNA-binding protein
MMSRLTDVVGERLYERATAAASAPRPLWHAGDGVSVFAGPLQRNAAHSHSVPVLLTGIYDAFDVRIAGGSWKRCGAAVVPAGTPYAFDMRGDPLAVVYLEPDEAGVTSLVPLVVGSREHGGALLGEAGARGVMRELYEDQGSAVWAEAALRDVLRFAGQRARPSAGIDPRIARIVRRLQRDGGGTRGATDAAAEIGLSASRFQHLFTTETGVPYRRYRGWQRMLTAIREVCSGASLTMAAHAAGYADQAHFAHEFRKRFGAAASPSLSHVRG